MTPTAARREARRVLSKRPDANQFNVTRGLLEALATEPVAKSADKPATDAESVSAETDPPKPAPKPTPKRRRKAT